MKKIFRGMRLTGARLIPKEIENRRKKLMAKKNSCPKPKKHGKVCIRDERAFGFEEDNPTLLKLMKRFRGGCLGMSKRKCPNCEDKPLLLRWREALGKEHLSCAVCGYTNAKLPSKYE